MAHYATQSYYQTSSLPMAMPSKSPHYYQASVRGAYAVSPPEVADSVTTGSGMNSGYSASSYAGSASGYDDSTGSANGVDLHDYMQDRFATAFDPLKLDRSLATQAVTSGTLNAKQRELEELRAKVRARTAGFKSRVAEGLQDAKEVRQNLEYTSKHMSAMKSKASKKHPTEYRKARERYPSPEY